MFLHFNWFIEKNLYFVRKHFWENLVYIVTFVLQFFCVSGYAVMKHQFPNKFALIS